MGLEVRIAPSSKCGLGIELPGDVLARTKIKRFREFYAPGPDGPQTLWAGGHLKLEKFVFDPGLVASCRLRVRLGEEVGRRVEVIARQVFGKKEVGRITWRLMRQD
jgi:hypothetical protein